ncbi:MAG: PTS glucose transporter subunit IIA, partial [Eubacteriaceae bacterium]|nr:PTS glucose transporter subunit IIA [Eubacteriaceae bacterium]
KGFKAFVKQGDQVKKGDLLLELDLDYISKNSPSTAIPIVFTNLEENQQVKLIKSGKVMAKEDAFAIES